MAHSIEDLQKRLEALSPELQEKVLSISTNTDLYEIAMKHKLTFSQAAELADEVGLTLLGLTPVSGFGDRAQDRMKLFPSEKAHVVTAEVERKFLENLSAPSAGEDREVKKQQENPDTSRIHVPIKEDQPQDEGHLRIFKEEKGGFEKSRPSGNSPVSETEVAPQTPTPSPTLTPPPAPRNEEEEVHSLPSSLEHSASSEEGKEEEAPLDEAKDTQASAQENEEVPPLSPDEKKPFSERPKHTGYTADPYREPIE